MPALTITTDTLTAGVVGRAYSARLVGTGGVAPLRWSVSSKDAVLSWLTVQPSTGEVSGTPGRATTEPAAVQFSLTDARGNRADRTLTLQVDACADDGVPVTCFTASQDACARGTTRCVNGALGACEATAPSDEPGHCGVDGSSCGACDAETANRCADGRCMCGLEGPCAAGSVCCGEGETATCVDPLTSAGNCGACGTVCEGTANGVGVCRGGQCEQTCAAGFVTCDPTRACAVNRLTDANNCGSCGNSCSDPMNPGTSQCVEGFCVCGATGSRCTQGDACCPAVGALPDRCANLAQGTDLGRTVTDCNACGKNCAAPGGDGPGEALCNSGVCGGQCLTDAQGDQWRDCRPDVRPGLESICQTNITNGDPANCSACGKKCEDDPNGTEACVNSTCRTTCKAGFDICENQTGCKDLTQATTCNCKDCKTLSSAFLATKKAAQTGCCSDVDPVTGSCRDYCTTGQDPAQCACRFECQPGFADCNNDIALGTQTDGCESELAVGVLRGNGDIANCNACGNTCPNHENASPFCNGKDANGNTVAGCSYTCDAGWANCNGDWADGCEVDLHKPESCGACGAQCPPAGANVATGTCTAAMTCAITCADGFADCNKKWQDGCETPLGTEQDCNSCGNACGTRSTCEDRQCQYNG